MRVFLDWFNTRRRFVTFGLMALALYVALSAGRQPSAGDWVRIPDLSLLFAVVLGILALLGLVVLMFGRPSAEVRRSGEVRSIRALVILTVLVAAATLWFGSQETVEEVLTTTPEEAVTPTSDDVGLADAADSVGASGADIVILILILFVVVVAVVRSRRTPSTAPPAHEAVRPLPVELAPAVDRAHQHLRDEADPRSAVLVAYASLEHALAEQHRERQPWETPGEHMARVLDDMPVLAAPAIRLGKLYEVARFSGEVITESDRNQATQALGSARESMALARPGRL